MGGGHKHTLTIAFVRQHTNFICLIFFLGQELEGEGNDRRTLSLPGQQLALLQQAVASGDECYH